MDGSKSLHEKCVLHHLKLVVSGSRILHNGSLRWSFRPHLLKQTYPKPNAFANSLYQETTVDVVGSRHSKLCKEMQVSYLKSASYLLMVAVLHEKRYIDIGRWFTVVYSSCGRKFQPLSLFLFFRSKRMELTNSRFRQWNSRGNPWNYWVICHWRNLKVPGELTCTRCFHGCNQATSRSTCHMAKQSPLRPMSSMKSPPSWSIQVLCLLYMRECLPSIYSDICILYQIMYHRILLLEPNLVDKYSKTTCMLHWPTGLL